MSIGNLENGWTLDLSGLDEYRKGLVVGYAERLREEMEADEADNMTPEEATAELEAIPGFHESMERAEADIQAGRVMSLEDVLSGKPAPWETEECATV